MTRTRTLSLLIALILSLAFVMTPVLARTTRSWRGSPRTVSCPPAPTPDPSPRSTCATATSLSSAPVQPARTSWTRPLPRTFLNRNELVRGRTAASRSPARSTKGPTAGRWVLNASPSLQGRIPILFTHRLGPFATHSPVAFGLLHLQGWHNIATTSRPASSVLRGSVFDFSDRHQPRSTTRTATATVSPTNFTPRSTAPPDHRRSRPRSPARLQRLARLLPAGYDHRQCHAGTDLVYDFDFVSRVVSPAEWLWTGYGYVRYYDCEATEVSGSQNYVQATH